MKKIRLLITILLVSFLLTGCDFISSIVDKTTKEPTIDKTQTEQIEPTDTPIVDEGKLTSSQTCTHKFISDVCNKCQTKYNEQIYNIFNSNTIIYDNDSILPYDIDLDEYGSNVSVVFYSPQTINDIYIDVDKKEFYNSYTCASTYEEAHYRTKHHLMSGDIADQNYLAPNGKIMFDASAIKCNTAMYILDYQGNYIGYIPNNLEGDNRVIWYGGAYISFNDVAAYLYAFGEVPVNNDYDKDSGRNQSVSDWNKYGRCNIGTFYANSTRYPYQPDLPKSKSQTYTETDFGTQGGYTNVNRITETYYYQTVYNNGSRISRGAARFCFVNNKKKIDDRYVFYTYNHYNDFQEYLNYDNGFGVRFGNESAGNQYCGSASDYEESNEFPPTQYQSIVIKTYLQILDHLDSF